MPSLYVGNLPDKSFFDLDLKKFFEQKGFKIKTATVISDPKTQKLLGYGYISFGDDQELDRCIQTLNNTTFEGKQLILSRSDDSTKTRDPNANIIVRNLPKEVTQNDIHKHF